MYINAKAQYEHRHDNYTTAKTGQRPEKAR
jgi:hypothetical protein